MTSCKISEHYCSSVGCLTAATDKLALVLLNPLSTEEHLKASHPQFEHSYNQAVLKENTVQQCTMNNNALSTHKQA